MISGRSEQEDICRRFNVEPEYVDTQIKVGVAKNIRDETIQPLNGLRHPATDDTSGWYIWRGAEPSDDPDFFDPFHAEHLRELCPAAIRYLALPAGWRFLVASSQEDVWFDSSLLDV